MSFYATLAGYIRCPDVATFDGLLHRLQEGGWVRQDQFQNESDNTDGRRHIFRETLELFIPEASYRNLARVNFFDNPETIGYVRGSSTDGCAICWVDGPTDIRIPEMPVWLFSDEDDEPDTAEGYLDWLAEAEMNFHNSAYEYITATYREYSAKKSPVSGKNDDAA
jgi:hypothetical protein